MCLPTRRVYPSSYLLPGLKISSSWDSRGFFIFVNKRLWLDSGAFLAQVSWRRSVFCWSLFLLLLVFSSPTWPGKPLGEYSRSGGRAHVGAKKRPNNEKQHKKQIVLKASRQKRTRVKPPTFFSKIIKPRLSQDDEILGPGRR